MAKQLPAGWYDIEGGPSAPGQFFPPNEPVEGRPVYLGVKIQDSPRETRYYWALKGKTFIVKYMDKVTKEVSKDAA
jgi:hypothetical protein